MNASQHRPRRTARGYAPAAAALAFLVVVAAEPARAAGCRLFNWYRPPAKPMASGGDWYWVRSPDQEKRVTIGQYNRYCVRCHGVDGRGVWDIPDVPDFANVRWQQVRSDGQLVRGILEGRGACMPPFRGTLTLEEAWAMAHYLRTFVPGTEQPRPDKADPAPPNNNQAAPPGTPPGPVPTAGR